MKTIVQVLLLFACASIRVAPSAAQCAFNPTVNGNLLLCPDESTLLGTQSYDSYQWYSRSFPNGTSTPVAGAVDSTFTVDVTDVPVYISVAATKDGCTEQSPEVLVDGLAFLPVTVSSSGNFETGPNGEQVICQGDTIYQVALQPYTVNIQWYDGQNPIAGATDDTLIVTQPGNYWMTGAPGECPNYEASLGVQIPVIWGTGPGCTTAIAEPMPALEAFIMPNPAGASLLVAVDVTEAVRLSLFDMQGNILRETAFKVATELYTGDLPSGLYNLRLLTPTRSLSKQVVVQ